MLSRIFHSQAKTITFAAFLLAFSGLISGFLGLIRDRLLAARFGAGEVLDVYFAAFRIPDFIYAVLIAGGISAVFLPLFSDYFEKEKGSAGKSEWGKMTLEFTNNILNSLFIAMLILCVILALFAPLLIGLVAPGFSQTKAELTVKLVRIMFLSPILLGLSSLFSSVLQYFNKFLAFGLSPIFYNLGIIFGILFFTPAFGVFGLALGVILGAFSHLLVQLPAVKKSGFKYKPLLNLKHPGLKKVFALILPRIVGSAASHINLVIITAIASTLAAGSIAIFVFSYNLHYFPIGLVGVSFAVSSFPAFSRSFANGNRDEFLSHFSSSVRQIIFFVSPIVLLIFLLRAQIVRIVLGSGEFGWTETRLTAASLGIFCIGIFAGSLIPILVRAFFSFKDTKTPVAAGLLAVGVNIGAAFLFVFLLGFDNAFRNFFSSLLKIQDIENIKVIGLSLAFSLSVIIHLSLLLGLLYRKVGRLRITEIYSSARKIAVSALLMSAAVYFVRQFAAGFVDMDTFFGVFLQTAMASASGILAYILISAILKCPEVLDVRDSLLKQLGSRHK